VTKIYASRFFSCCIKISKFISISIYSKYCDCLTKKLSFQKLVLTRQNLIFDSICGSIFDLFSLFCCGSISGPFSCRPIFDLLCQLTVAKIDLSWRSGWLIEVLCNRILALHSCLCLHGLPIALTHRAMQYKVGTVNSIRMQWPKWILQSASSRHPFPINKWSHPQRSMGEHC
jgi:hypothetical protein